MAKALHRLTVKEIAAAVPGTALNDGGGLFFRATAKGQGKWVFKFTSADPAYLARQAERGSVGRQREMGLGAYPAVGLAVAREKAAAARATMQRGQDPIETAQKETASLAASAAAQAKAETFGAYADGFVDWKIRAAAFSNPKHIYQWRQTFERFALTLRGKKLADVTRQDVLAVLEPIWDTLHDTATRVRGRLEQMFDHAIQNGAYPHDNPARWKLFNATLSKPRKLPPPPLI